MKLVVGITLIVGIVLVGVGVFLWQDGLNMQKLTTLEEASLMYARQAQTRILAGEDKEVLGLTLLAVGGVLSLGGGIGLITIGRK
ncbi:MAG: hypothetical protein JSV32_07475 [Dehalococcoidia bacterium]|nr:MAG: hypothetical protein JSV32_07475 [Dehalococcoidia bacterium]